MSGNSINDLDSLVSDVIHPVASITVGDVIDVSFTPYDSNIFIHGLIRSMGMSYSSVARNLGESRAQFQNRRNDGRALERGLRIGDIDDIVKAIDSGLELRLYITRTKSAII